MHNQTIYINILQQNALHVLNTRMTTFPEIQICVVTTVLSCKYKVHSVTDMNLLTQSNGRFLR